jgi:hypothetical protein
MVLTTPEYIQKIAALLHDPAYQKLTQDPTESVERKTRSLVKSSLIAEEVWKRLCPTDSKTPGLYGLPKIHKQGVPLRLTVSNVGVPTYQLARHLAGLLNPLTGHSQDREKNLIDFVDTLHSLRVRPEDIMSGFDVVSLFTNALTADFPKILGRHFSENIVALFTRVLTSTYFVYHGQYYNQTDGDGVGSTMSPVIAEFFVEDFEVRILEPATHKLLCWSAM